MLSSFLYLLLFETVQPSQNTFLAMIPEHIVASATFTQKETKAPIKKGDSMGPVIEAHSVYAIDLRTGAPLFVRDIFTRRKIASIAKLVTAMVILDNHKLDEKLIVSKNAASQEGSTMWLREREEIKVGSALTGMLVNSGNDAAVALAEFDSKTEAAFVIKMNAKAQALGLQNTHFSNAKGFDEDSNYSTAEDAVIFSKAALNYAFIRDAVSIKNGEVKSTNGRVKHKLESTNELLENPYFNVVGLKTGSSPAAGESFVALVKAANGNEVLTVMLDSPNRFKETKILIDWILRNYEFQ